MVTKQEQLEWLAKECDEWPVNGECFTMSRYAVGACDHSHVIKREEWQQQRDKMRKQDSSWHERGELPPVGVPVELWFGGSFVYNCEFISRRGNNYVLWNLDSDKADSADYMHSQFRPLCTERENAIDEMVKLIGNGWMSADTAMDLAIKIYDAGFHK